MTESYNRKKADLLNKFKTIKFYPVDHFLEEILQVTQARLCTMLYLHRLSNTQYKRVLAAIYNQALNHKVYVLDFAKNEDFTHQDVFNSIDLIHNNKSNAIISRNTQLETVSGAIKRIGASFVIIDCIQDCDYTSSQLNDLFKSLPDINFIVLSQQGKMQFDKPGHQTDKKAFFTSRINAYNAPYITFKYSNKT